jgi:hypothetical protein
MAAHVVSRDAVECRASLARSIRSALTHSQYLRGSADYLGIPRLRAERGDAIHRERALRLRAEAEGKEEAAAEAEAAEAAMRRAHQVDVWAGDPFLQPLLPVVVASLAAPMRWRSDGAHMLDAQPHLTDEVFIAVGRWLGVRELGRLACVARRFSSPSVVDPTHHACSSSSGPDVVRVSPRALPSASPSPSPSPSPSLARLTQWTSRPMQWSVVEEAARQQIVAHVQAGRDWVPRRSAKWTAASLSRRPPWLTLLHELHGLLAPRRFGTLEMHWIHKGAHYQLATSTVAPVIALSNCGTAATNFGDSWSTAACDSAELRGGRHWLEVRWEAGEQLELGVGAFNETHFSKSLPPIHGDPPEARMFRSYWMYSVRTHTGTAGGDDSSRPAAARLESWVCPPRRGAPPAPAPDAAAVHGHGGQHGGQLAAPGGEPTATDALWRLREDDEEEVLATAKLGDRIGLLLDLNEGSLRYYINRKPAGMLVKSGLVGPLFWRARLWKGASVRILAGSGSVPAELSK